jgi:hypothetical protein
MNLKQKLVVAIGSFALALGNGMIAATVCDKSAALIIAVVSFLGGLIWFNLPASRNTGAKA